MSSAGLLLLVGTVAFVLLYRFWEPLLDFVFSLVERVVRALAPPLPEETERTRERMRGRTFLRDLMAVLCSLVFGAWALYVLVSHPDAIIKGPVYDAATKQAATGAMGAILGLWLGKGVE